MWKLLAMFGGTRRDSREAGLRELRAELNEFSYDGLITLRDDLEAGCVRIGTWDGCVLSYRRGCAGSVDRDRKGRRGNAFTKHWDASRIRAPEVVAAVDAELARRGTARPPVYLLTHPRPKYGPEAEEPAEI